MSKIRGIDAANQHYYDPIIWYVQSGVEDFGPKDWSSDLRIVGVVSRETQVFTETKWRSHRVGYAACCTL